MKPTALLAMFNVPQLEGVAQDVDDILEVLQAAFHQKRQTSIDAELFDVISGFKVA